MIIKETHKNITIIHHVDEDKSIWGSSGRKVLTKHAKGDWNHYCKFPFSIKRDLFNFSRITSRIARSDKCNIYVNKRGKVIGIRDGKVYQLSKNDKPHFLFSINGDSVLHGGICEDVDGNIYFGEYFMNPERKPVNIWKIDSEIEKWEIAYQFEAGEIRHIHGVYVDPYFKNSLWITTGDFENECYIYNTQDSFQTVQKNGEGTQVWRAVRLFFTPEYICWLTDSNLEQNYACRMNRNTKKLEVGQKINASSWYGFQTATLEFIAFTTVEPGPGIMTNHSQILYSYNGFNWEIIKSFKKDFWRPMNLFKYGVISCPSGKMTIDDFHISGEGLIGLDGISKTVDLYQYYVL